MAAAPSAQRMSAVLRHLAPGGAADGDGAITAAKAAGPAAMLQGLLPLAAIGAYMMWQRRGKTEEVKGPPSEMELRQEAFGFDTERLEALATWAEALVKTKKVPGMVVLIAREGEVIYHEAFGDRTYQKDTVLEMQSLSTPVITAALMTLVEEGLVSLDDSVTKYLPYFSKFTVYRGGTTDATLETTPIGLEMTIRHLLTHTWGFPGQRHMATTDPAVRMLDSLAADLNPTIGVDADFEALTEVPLIAQPGQQYRFSLGISVVAHIITKVTGVPLHEFVSERIFTPLGMAESGWSVPATDQHRVGQHVKAVPKLTGESGLRFTGPEKGHTSWLGWKGKPERRDVPAEVPAAGVKGLSGLYSTATDCLAFQQMLMNGGKTAAGAAVLSAESVAAMTGDQLGAVAPGMRLDEKEFNTHANDKKNSPGRVSPAFGVDAPGQGIGLGLNVVVSPVGSKQAAMAGGYSSPACYNGTEWWNDPALGLSIFYGTQLAPFYALPEIRQELAGCVYGSLVPSAAAKNFQGGKGAGGDSGGMGSMMSMMMMMSMMGGMGRM